MWAGGETIHRLEVGLGTGLLIGRDIMGCAHCERVAREAMDERRPSATIFNTQHVSKKSFAAFVWLLEVYLRQVAPL